MRTSNKILLITFLSALIIMVSVQLALYARYKSGDFVVETPHIYKSHVLNQGLAGINSIYIGGLDNVEVRYSDTPRIEVDYDFDSTKVKISTSKDTLVLKSGERNPSGVTLYVNGATHIIAASSNINLRGSTDSTRVLSLNIKLSDGVRLQAGYEDFSADLPIYYFKALDITSMSSSIELHGNVSIEQLSISLEEESNLIDGGATIKSLGINPDKSSTVLLKGGNFRKIHLP